MVSRCMESPSDLPCSAPPWGLLTAVDMNEGKIRWQVPLGSMQDFGGAHAQQIPPGSISLGGPIVTAGGIVFFPGPPGLFLPRFVIENRKEMWETPLPPGAQATTKTHCLANNPKQELLG